MILTKHWFQVHPHRPRVSHSQRYSPPLWSSFLPEETMGTLSNDDDDDGSENVAKKMNLRSFKLNRVYLDPLNMSNAGDFSWS